LLKDFLAVRVALIRLEAAAGRARLEKPHQLSMLAVPAVLVWRHQLLVHR
jgi:hypothetical protein